MMEEGQSAPGAYRGGMISKVRGYRYQLDKLKKDIVSVFIIIYDNSVSNIYVLYG